MGRRTARIGSRVHSIFESSSKPFEKIIKTVTIENLQYCKLLNAIPWEETHHPGSVQSRLKEKPDTEIRK